MADHEALFDIQDHRYYGVSFLKADSTAAVMIGRALASERDLRYGQFNVEYLRDNHAVTVEGYAPSYSSSRTALSALTKAVRRVAQNEQPR